MTPDEKKAGFEITTTLWVNGGCCGCPFGIEYRDTKPQGTGNFAFCKALQRSGELKPRALFREGEKYFKSHVMDGCPLLKRGKVVIYAAWSAEDQPEIQNKILEGESK